jgi:hypothetical protein
MVSRYTGAPHIRLRGFGLSGLGSLPPVCICSFCAGEIPLHPAPDPVDPSNGRGSRCRTVVHMCVRTPTTPCVWGGQDLAVVMVAVTTHEAGWLNPCVADADLTFFGKKNPSADARSSCLPGFWGAQAVSSTSSIPHCISLVALDVTI